jgi:protein-export membrane protein SecD
MNNFLAKFFSFHGRNKIRWIFSFIILLTLAGVLIDAGSYYNRLANKISDKTGKTVVLPHLKEVPFRLGLDLLGGSHLVYKIDLSRVPAGDQDNVLAGVRDVIEKRVNKFGVSEPIVQINKSGDENQVIVELAGIKDINEAIKQIGETPLLEFKEPSTNKTLTADQQKGLDDFNKKAETKATEVLGKIISNGDFGALAKVYSEDDKTKDTNGELDWVSQGEIFNIAAKLKKGEYTKDLVKTAAGYEIVKSEDERLKTDPFNDKVNEKEIHASHILICFKGAQGCTTETGKEDALAKIKALKASSTPANFADLAKNNSTEPGADQSGGDLGWFRKGMMVKPFEDVVFAQKVGAISDPVETDFGYHLVYKQGERDIKEYKVRHIFVKTKTAEDILGPASQWQNTELSGKNLTKASISFDNLGVAQVSLEFDDAGAKLFEDITARNVGKQVAIFLDTYPISVPTVNEKITGGKAVISGKFTVEEAKLLVQRLNAGALPAPIELISQETVGASLGKDSVDKSLFAAIIGLAIIILFLLIFYRLPGLLASIALLIYGVLILAVFKIWPVTLTLPGLAGFVMSLGMAVDANILIFERMKEELRAGKPLTLSMSEGFRRAWPSIRDGNFSTLITCFILIQFSTSVVRGFAVTLMLGIIISMFSAIIITKNLLNLIMGEWMEKRMWLVGRIKK